jgi:hypothetical protein
LHHHQYSNGFRLFARFDLRNDPAATEVRRRGFRNEQLRREQFDMLDVQCRFAGNFVALSGKRCIDFIGGTGAEIQNEDSHRSDNITVCKTPCWEAKTIEDEVAVTTVEQFEDRRRGTKKGTASVLAVP